jgi:hypothetical protein
LTPGVEGFFMGFRVDFSILRLGSLDTSRSSDETISALVRPPQGRTASSFFDDRSTNLPLPESKNYLSSVLSGALTLAHLPDAQSRDTATPGFGDRAYGSTNSEVPTTTFKFPLADPVVADESTYRTDTELTQKEMMQIRGSMAEISKAFVLTHPQATTDELQTEVDRYLGDGVSSLFNLRIVDNGGGRSSIVADQVQAKDLIDSDRVSLKTAAANAFANFAPVSFDHTLFGSDVRSSSPEQLANLDEANVNSFDANSLMDDFRIDFTSNKFGNAFGSDAIDRQAAFTNTPGWTTAGHPQIAKRSR